MKVVDMVFLKEELFYEHDEWLGLILTMVKEFAGKISCEVFWNNGEFNMYYDYELEVINEAG